VKLGVLSNDRLAPTINWTTLGPPLLKPLASSPDADLVSPPPLDYRNWKEWRSVLCRVRSFDTLFWMQGSSRPESAVWLPSALAGRAHRSAFVVDAWRPVLGRIGALAIAQRLDPCFVAFREAYDELVVRFPRGHFEWLPFGVATDVFAEVSEMERDIFAYWMGRRHEALHRALLSYCLERGLKYYYTRRGGEISVPHELGRLVARSRYFVVTPPDLSNSGRTGGFSPLVMRYMEGLSAGARLLGVLPKSGEYEALLPPEAMLLVRADGSDLATRLDEDTDNDAGWAAVRRGRDLVRERHSWSCRAEYIHQRLANGG